MSENTSRYEEHIIYSYTKIFGKYESSNLSIQIVFGSHFWPKYFYVIIIKDNSNLDINTQEWNKWNYRNYIEDLCYSLSLKYWKVFWYLWLLKDESIYKVIDFSQNKLKYWYLPWNTQNNRVDITDELNLYTNIWPFSERILNKLTTWDEKLFKFLDIVYFYHKWILNSEFDIEISYIDFVRAVEISFNFIWISGNWEDYFEWNLLKIYEKIKDNEELSKFFKEQNWSTKKFVNSIINYLPIESDFRKITESKWSDFSLNKIADKGTLIKILKNIYSIRSKYMHCWLSFWRFVLPDNNWLNDFIDSQPVYKSGIKIQETLTLLWLERIVRAYLLNIYDLEE